MSRFFAAFIAAALATACMSTSQPGAPAVIAPDAIQVQPGDTFDLKAGQKAQIRGTPITVRFVSVGQDSRCPSDVQCIWAGDAAITLRLTSTAAAVSELIVHTNLEPRAIVYSGYQVRATDIRPAPKSGTPIPATEYVVRLQIAAK